MMDFIIVFFRDILSGPLYIVLTIINTILICSCIGYLGENYLNRKKLKAKYDSTYTTVSSTAVSNTSASIQQTSQTTNNQL